MRKWIAPASSAPVSPLDLERGTKARHLLERLYEHQLTVPACLDLLRTAMPAAHSLDWSLQSPVAAALSMLYAETITVAKCVELLQEAASPAPSGRTN